MTRERMTRETAAALLNNLRAFAEDDDEPAIDMAIEALTHTDSDLISREDLIDEMLEMANEFDNTMGEYDSGVVAGYSLAISDVRRFPSANIPVAGDLIRREDAIKAIAEMGFVDEDDGRCHDWDEDIAYAKDVLSKVPSATVPG